MKNVRIGLGALLLGASLLLQPSAIHAATDRVQVSLPDFPVTVNGTVLDVRHSEYPLLVYKDITYFPMTWNNTVALGLTAQWDPQTGFSLQQSEQCQPLRQDLTPDLNSTDDTRTAKPVPFPVHVNGQAIDNAAEPYPLLLYRDITYFPMTWRFAHDGFGWTTSWDDQAGFGLSSCGGATNTQDQQAEALNVANGGQLAVQGDWVYVNPQRNYFGDGQLMKWRLDGSDKVKLSSENVANLSVEGDWLYYTIPSENKPGSIMKRRTDGTGRQPLSSGPAESLWVKDGWIYYTHDTDGGGYFWTDGLHRMKTDGTGDEAILTKGQDSSFSGFFVEGDSIYYVVGNRFYRMNLDGTDKHELRADVTRAVFVDGWIYYVTGDGKQLNKMSEDGQVVIPLYTSPRRILTIQYHQGWLYLADGSFGIMGSGQIDKLRLDGTGVTEVTPARSNALYFAGDTLYANHLFDGNSQLNSLDVK